MKTLLAATAALTFGAGLAAQAPDQAELASRRDAKLAEPWLKQAPWVTDLDEAKALSAKTGKPIFTYFSRSYSP